MTKYILEVIWILEDGDLKPSKGEGIQVPPPIWEGLETLKEHLRFQVPFPKTSNQTYGKGTWNHCPSPYETPS